MVVRALKAGSLNFLEKPCRNQQLWEAIQEALKWDALHRPQLAQRSKATQRLERLTPGEHAVLESLVKGKSNKAIAVDLGLSVRTIEVRRAKLMKKMKAESLAQLIRLVLLADPNFGKSKARH
jgi:FixJ family two-component response regulator